MHGWDNNQRALQLVSYLDETAMNVAQELGDDELYNYDILVKLLGDRFDPASRVSASRSRFHGRLRRHHEDADSFADAITDLCRVGYPQSSPELRQELISEQFVRGQSDPELKKYLWVVIRTQKDRKLQTLIEVKMMPPRYFKDCLNFVLAAILFQGKNKKNYVWFHEYFYICDKVFYASY